MRAFGLVVALAACFAGTKPSMAAASRALRCPARGAHVLLHDARSAVYWFPHRSEEGREEGSAVYACTRSHRAVALQEVIEHAEGAGPCAGYTGGCLPTNWRRTIALAGTMLAYATYSPEPSRYYICDCRHWGITVVDLSTGRVVHRVPTGPHHGTVKPEGSLEEKKPDHGDLYVGVGPAEQVIVKPNGSVAWIAEDFIAWLEAFREGREHEPPTYELRVIDQTGERLIASGATLDPHSLVFHGDRLEYELRSSTVVN